YPITGSACLTTESGCTNGGNTTLDANLATIGTIPRSVPSTTGISLTYANTTWDGAVQPLRMSYLLHGVNQKCGSGRVSAYAYPGYFASTTGYTNGNHEGTGKTLCWISIPGPETY